MMLVILELVSLTAAASVAVALGVYVVLGLLPRPWRLAGAAGGGLCMVLLGAHLFVGTTTAPRPVVVTADTDVIVKDFIWSLAQADGDDEKVVANTTLFAERLNTALKGLADANGWVIVPAGTPVAGQGDTPDITPALRQLIGINAETAVAQAE